MKERCPVCGQVAEMIWVRAHYQCAACGQVVIACCNGETALACSREADAGRGESLLAASHPRQPAEPAGEGS